MPSSHEIGKPYAVSSITDFRRKQLPMSFTATPSPQLHYHFLSALSRFKRLLATPTLVRLTMYPMLTAYAAAILHMPSDLAPPF